MLPALAHPRALAARLTGPDRLLGPALALAAGLLMAGWFLPILTVEELWWIERTVSIAQGLLALFEAGDYFVFAVILLFTVAFPVIKIGAAYTLLFHVDMRAQGLGRWLGRIDALGKWSMLDVFVVALMVVAIKMNWLADVVVHAGIWVFGAAILIAMAAVRRLVSLAQAAGE